MNYTTSCNTQSSAPEDGRDQRPKHVELIGIINKPLLLYLVGVYIICINDARSNKYQIYELLNLIRSTENRKSRFKVVLFWYDICNKTDILNIEVSKATKIRAFDLLLSSVNAFLFCWAPRYSLSSGLRSVIT